MATRYSEALAGHAPIESQRKAPKRVKKLVKGLSEKQLAKRPAPDKWSIKEVLAHLADGEFVLGARIRCVAGMDRPTIVGYDENAFVRNLAVDKTDSEHFLEAYAALRALNVALLERLPEEAFTRVGLHTERGEESLDTMVTMYAGHDRLHEAQIERIKAALFPPKATKTKDKDKQAKKQADASKSNQAALEPKAKRDKQKNAADVRPKQDRAAEHFAKAEKQVRKEEKKRRKEALKAARKVARKAAKKAQKLALAT